MVSLIKRICLAKARIINYFKEADEGEPAKKKFIFLSEQDEEGTTLYSTSSSSSLLPSSSKTPLILDTNVSGAVGSVIEVTNHEIIGKTEEVQTFSFETGDDEKYELIEGGHAFHSEEDEEEESEGLVKPFACELCKKQFTKIEILKRHIKTHMKEKEFKCSYCTKTFDRRDVLNDHVRNHTGEKPFQVIKSIHSNVVDNSSISLVSVNFHPIIANFSATPATRSLREALFCCVT